MAKQINIKISGSGSKKEILEALKKLVRSIYEESEEGLSLGKTFEDETLITETN